MNYPALAAELAAGHPVTGAYDADDATALAQLKAVNVQQTVEAVTGQDIFEAAVAAEYAALSDDFKRLFHAIIGMGDIQVSGTNTKAALFAMFGAGTDTRANLIALAKENVSRESQLGLGTIKLGHVQKARE